MFELTLDVEAGELARYREGVKAVASATHRTATEVMREELKDLVLDLVQSTPPGVGKGLDQAREIGEAKVRRDIRRTFRPISTLRVMRNPLGSRLAMRLQAAVRSGDTGLVDKILSAMGFVGVRVIARADPALHQAARDDKGHVPEGFRSYIVLDEASVREFEEEMLKHVGRAKAGWEPAARALGVALPDWITRHETPGKFEDRTTDPNEPSFTISNGVEYGDDFGELKILESALERAEKRLGRKLDAALSALSEE